MRACRALASLKLTLSVLVALGVGVLIAYLSEVRTTWSLATPLALFALNLAAVATNSDEPEMRTLGRITPQRRNSCALVPSPYKAPRQPWQPNLRVNQTCPVALSQPPS